MKPWLALIRGINVGGRRVIRMETLREIFANAGCDRLRSYIQSGNVLFTHDETDAGKMASHLETVMKQTLDMQTRVILRTPEQMQAIVDLYPFGHVGPDEDVKRSVSSLAREPRHVPELPILSPRKDVEIFRYSEGQVYCLGRRVGKWYGMPSDQVEKSFGVTATARNWNVTQKLAELCRSHFA